MKNDVIVTSENRSLRLQRGNRWGDSREGVSRSKVAHRSARADAICARSDCSSKASRSRRPICASRVRKYNDSGEPSCFALFVHLFSPPEASLGCTGGAGERRGGGARQHSLPPGYSRGRDARLLQQQGARCEVAATAGGAASGAERGRGEGGEEPEGVYSRDISRDNSREGGEGGEEPRVRRPAQVASPLPTVAPTHVPTVHSLC